MYVVADGVKLEPVRRWSSPDRVFFACGACHILAFAFLKAYPQSGFAPLWPHWQPHRGGTRRHGLRLSWLFKLEPSVRPHRSESEPPVARMVCSAQLFQWKF